MLYTNETASYCNAWIEKGLHELDFETYVQVDAANSHGLMDIQRSPMYYKWRKGNPVDKDEYSFGKLVHWLILEPGFIENKVKLKKKVDGRTKEGRAYNEEFAKTIKPSDFVMDEVQYETALMLRDSLHKHPWTRKIIGKGVAEHTGFWVHPEHEVFCKSRFDLIFQNCIFDIKTTANASKNFFSRQIDRLHYDLQAAFYVSAYRNIFKKDPELYLFICVESEPPHDIAVYVATKEGPTSVYATGFTKVARTLLTYAQCCKTGVWPGYEQNPQDIFLPAYVAGREEE